jgi:hypothetical protein
MPGRIRLSVAIPVRNEESILPELLRRIRKVLGRCPAAISPVHSITRADKLRKIEHQLEIQDWNYWGLPLVPSLLTRRVWPVRSRIQNHIVTSGFDPGSSWINCILQNACRFEWIPRKLLRTCIMAILQASAGEGRKLGITRTNFGI